ncbi:MAG: large repetitive protein, partial [Patescibacteria group bacterium]|nr:large repetitive protein [Patescibacteria group bacterium]
GADGAKNFSIVLKDAQNNPSTAANVTITADRTAPSVVSMPSSGVSHNAATVTFTIGETGTGYYLVQAGGGAPSVGTVVSSGTPVSLTANVGQAVSLSGLSAATAYDVYFVTKDALGNTSLSVSTVSFTTSAAPNTAPTISTAPTNQTTGKNTSSAVGMTVADTESGAAAVTVTATSSNQSIVKDANVVVSAGAGGSRTITVTPEAGATGTVTINYVATDGGGLTANGSYTVTFTNAAPVISASVSNQSYDQNAAISALTLPSATDADVGETVTYSVSALPAGLSFNSGTRQITGTPTGTGTTTVTYTATDASGATDTKTFDIVVSANVAPVMSGGAIGLSSGLNVTIAATPLNISDTGPMTVTFVADNGGRYNITGASGGSVSNNNSSSVTITGATTGAITFTFTPPSTDTNGIGGESSTITVTDSGGLSTSLNDFVFY